MSATQPEPTAKIHPATREVLPDDPMEMHAVEIPGDSRLMLQFLVEEYARMGWGLDDLMHLACDPNYQSFHGLHQLLGEQQLKNQIREILSRCGVMRVTSREAPAAPAAPENLVQIDLSR